MIKQLKRRVVTAAMISVTLVLTLIIGAINGLNYYSIVSDIDAILIDIHRLDGQFPEEDNLSTSTNDNFLQTLIKVTQFSPNESYKDSYFSMTYKDGSFGNFVHTDRSQAEELGKKALAHDKESGFIFELTGIYRYYVDEEYIPEAEDEGEEDIPQRLPEYTRVTFIDASMTMQYFFTFFGLSATVSVVSLLIILVMMAIFAQNIISPIAESYEKQKRFITDAGHDIKTPITIIDADREILEMDIGENEWLDDIKRQTKRLTKLTNDLIYLSRMEEGTDVKELSNFSLSDLCQEEADSFSAVAKKRDLEITSDIEESIDINGSEEDVRKLLAILFDNAIKYAKEGTDIGIKVTKHGRLATVTISNVAENMTEEHCKRMFDRFYRADSSRGSGGGFGIGLAMAQAIVLSHNGKIGAELSDNKVLSISATFPVQYGSFKLITNFADKKPKDANNSLQNGDVFDENLILDETDENDFLKEIDESELLPEESENDLLGEIKEEENQQNPDEEAENED
jgi:signal transduction histidine kinase